jgi:methyltransferase (TIGR00027 family)
VAAHRLGVARLALASGDPAADDALAADVAGGLVVDPSSDMASHLAARTAFFDRVVVDAISSGTAQVVVVGAGYDARSLRFAAPHVRYFEVDHPDTQRDKLGRLDALGIDASRVTFVAADLRDGDVALRLAAAGLGAQRPSLVLFEGVAAYLDDDVLVATLRQLRSATAPASALGISVGALDTPDVGHRRERLAAAVAQMGEHLTSTITTATLPEAIATTGWRVVDPSLASTDARRGFVLLANGGPQTGSGTSTSSGST